MESQSPLARKVPHCRVCGQPRKGHPRGLCGPESPSPSPGSTPEREGERFSSTTPQPGSPRPFMRESPKPLMPGRFSDQRPSEVFPEPSLLDRIGPKVEDVVDVDLFQPNDRPKREENEPDHGYGLGGLGRGLPPLRAQGQQNALGQRYPSTPLRQMPTLLHKTESMDTILPEHSVSNARIHVPRPPRSFSASASVSSGSDASSTTTVTATNSALRHGTVYRAPSTSVSVSTGSTTSTASSDTPSLTWSAALRETRARPLAILYAIPSRFGAYLLTKSRRSGADALLYPLAADLSGAGAGAGPESDEALLVHGERHFLAKIQPHRNVEEQGQEQEQELRHRTPARSVRDRTATPTPVAGPASPVAQATPPSPSPAPLLVSQPPPIAHTGARIFFGNILYIVVGVFIGISLTFYVLLRLDSNDDAHP